MFVGVPANILYKILTFFFPTDLKFSLLVVLYSILEKS